MILVTGATGLVGGAVVRQLAAQGGKITYRDISLDAFREKLVSGGAPPWLVEVRMEFTTVLREGFAATVTDTVARTTGRPPRSFTAFAIEHADRFRGPASP